jgi:hypothetical protein
MSRRVLLAAELVFILSLAGCGGASSGGTSNPTSPASPVTSTPTAPPAVRVTASGDNWSFRTAGFSGIGITGTLGRGAVLAALEGSFNPSGDAITAVLDPFGSCFNADQDRARFTGTRSGHTAELQSQPVNGQVVQLTGTLSSTGDMFDGAYSITGGCGNGSSGRMTGRPVNLTGIWSGTMGTIPTVFDLQMASAPDEDANYALSGSATFSNTQCFPKAVITRRARGRVLFPDVVGDTQRLELIAEVTEDLSTMQIVFALVAGQCPELSFGDGRLVRQ